MKKTQGFTLIELLVVIAIIGILSSVVLASLNTARTKAANASVKANLSGIRTKAELVYDTASPNSYDAVCTDENVVKAITAAASAGGATVGIVNAVQTATTAVCHDDADGWAVQAPLKSAEGTSVHWCIDSTGEAKGEASLLAADVVVCS